MLRNGSARAGTQPAQTGRAANEVDVTAEGQAGAPGVAAALPTQTQTQTPPALPPRQARPTERGPRVLQQHGQGVQPGVASEGGAAVAAASDEPCAAATTPTTPPAPPPRRARPTEQGPRLLEQPPTPPPRQTPPTERGPRVLQQHSQGVQPGAASEGGAAVAAASDEPGAAATMPPPTPTTPTPPHRQPRQAEQGPRVLLLHQHDPGGQPGNASEGGASAAAASGTPGATSTTPPPKPPPKPPSTPPMPPVPSPRQGVALVGVQARAGPGAQPESASARGAPGSPASSTSSPGRAWPSGDSRSSASGFSSSRPSSRRAQGAALRPVLILPGFMSSALLVQQSDLRGGLWEGERLWLSLRRLGLSGTLGDEDTIATGMAGSESVKVRDLWLQHMTLMPDLTSERPGVSVRAVPGLAGLEYLGGDNIIGHASWVFAPVVKLLRRNGYSGRSLQGATYDWRVPPWELERRDQYFSRTMQTIERLRETNGGRPVVLLCHSMGALVGHYLCGFAERARGRAWLDSHVDSLVLVGAPLLGAPSALTAFLVGTRMGLPAAFLNDQAALLMGRSLGSSVWLMPLAGSGGCSMRSVLGDGEGAFRPGTSFLRLHSELHVAARLADVSELWRRGVGAGSLGKLCVRVSFGGSSFLSRPFDASPGRVALFADLPDSSGGEDSARREFQMVFPAALGLCDRRAAALDPGCASADWLAVEVVEPRVALRRGLRRLLNVSTVSGSLLPGVLQSAARRAYDQTLGKVEKKLSWRVICAARVQVKDLLSAEQLERDLPERTVGPVPVRLELRAPRLDGLFAQARAEVELALTLTSHSALHLARGVPARREAVLLAAQLPSKRLLKQLSFFQYKDRSASDAVGSGPVPDVMGAGGGTGGALRMPFLSRLDKPEPRTVHVAYPPTDLLRMAKLDNVCELLARYEADPLINSNAPPVRRVVAVFGVNVPTERGTVMRRSARLTSTGRLEKDFELDDGVTISRRWATQQGLSVRNGVLLETRDSRHLCAATRRFVRASGDGTVPYESLTHVHRWASSDLDVAVHELDGVEHRGILKNKAFHKVLLDHLFEGIKAHSLSGSSSSGSTLGGSSSFSRWFPRGAASWAKPLSSPGPPTSEPGALRRSGRTTFVPNAASADHDVEDGEVLAEEEEEEEEEGEAMAEATAARAEATTTLVSM